VASQGEDRAAGADLVRQLRAAGLRAAQDLLRRPPEESIRCAREQGYAWAVLLGAAGSGPGEVQLVNAATEQTEIVPVGQIGRRLAGEE
jgi:histidyl-tRNA synthetase